MPDDIKITTWGEDSIEPQLTPEELVRYRDWEEQAFKQVFEKIEKQLRSEDPKDGGAARLLMECASLSTVS